MKLFMKVGDLVSCSDDVSVGPIGVILELTTYYDELLGKDYPAAKILIANMVALYRISELWAFHESR